MSSVPSFPPPPPPTTGTDHPPAAALEAAPSAETVPPPLISPAASPVALVKPEAPAAEEEPPQLPPVKLDWTGGVMSFLIPGLGQVYQGRIGKGMLFFVGLYALFFYGMWMGQWQNVWMPEVSDLQPLEVAGTKLPGVPSSIYYRPQFLGQFWIGVAAWPAVVQYYQFDPNKQAGSLFGTFQREPSEETLNKLQREGNKRWDLGWVYTVIAGVLNLLVIYDALAGPMFRDPPANWNRKDDAPAW
jgi:hypothetical protein